ncbi:MAG: YidC/Oxa1 family membrane protein insertase [Dehalococcoidia bacterium]
MDAIGFLWTELVTRPMTNGLVFFYFILGSNFGFAIIFFTIVTRVLMYPLTMRQLRQTRAMQSLAPRMKAVQAKYKDDRQRLQREQMRLYREAGVNPLGCLGPLIIQMPIFIGLFISIRAALADTPEGLVSLSQKLYSWLPGLNESIPLNSRFLGLNLGDTPADGPLPIVLPVLVGGTMWVVQKMAQTHTHDTTQPGVGSMMTWMLPLMFGFWTLAFPNGLAIYWVATNIMSIALQYRVTGWGTLAREPAPAPAATAASAGSARRREGAEASSPSTEPQAGGSSSGGLLKRILLGSPPAPAPEPPPASTEEGDATPPAATDEKGEARGSSRNDRQDRRRGDRKGISPARGRARRRRGHRRR